MAAGVVYHNMTTSSGVTFSVACYVPDTSAPDVGAIPVQTLLNAAGSPIAFGSGVTGATVIRTTQATDSPGVTALGQAALAASLPVAPASNWAPAKGDYETVAASQTAQPLGATGATGDFISGVLVIPATPSPGNVLLLDNATSITIFTGGATSVSNLVSFFIPLGMFSVSGAWKLTTGANVSCIGIGKFT